MNFTISDAFDFLKKYVYENHFNILERYRDSQSLNCGGYIKDYYTFIKSYETGRFFLFSLRTEFGDAIGLTIAETGSKHFEELDNPCVNVELDEFSEELESRETFLAFLNAIFSPLAPRKVNLR
jgi:hypothetical protein